MFSRGRFTSTSCRILVRNSSFCWRCDSISRTSSAARFGLQILEGEILQFAADFAHSEAMRDGRVDFERFLRDALLALARQQLESAHVVQPVGQLDDDDADIVDHGQQHLADALGLPFLARVEMEFAELGDAVHAARHFFAEFLADLVQAKAGVFHGVVQQARFQAHQIHLHVGQDQGDVERVNHVGLARHALLIFMRFRRPAVSFFKLGEIVLGPKHTDLLLELGVKLLDQTGGRTTSVDTLFLEYLVCVGSAPGL